MKTIKTLFLALAIVGFTSCSSDDPDHVHEEEVITTVLVTLTPSGGGTPITLEYKDLDGDGSGVPVTSVSGALAASTTYNGAITLSNETESPAEDITAEVSAEAADHQFFFTSGIGTVAYDDTDTNGNPIGLAFTLTTATATTGNLVVTLRHEPNKSASGVSTGDITNAGGETDVVATYTSIVVQ